MARAACILNIRNIHQAVRADQNLNKKNTTDELVRTTIMGDPEAYIENEPTCPADGGARHGDRARGTVANE